MAVLTSTDFSAQMVAQLRILDPNISAEVGTPERKIIDTVAQSLADNQVDLTGLSTAVDIDTKFGTNLDSFTALFGFARQGSTYASGYVTFGRNTPAPANIAIPVGTTIQSNTLTPNGQYLQYQTTTTGQIPEGATESGPTLVQCVSPGSQGNTAANTLTNPVGGLISGVTSVTNPAPLSNGTDQEFDDAYKARFKNTVFRNLAGTQDQYLALALSTTFSTKANVIGPISTYQEYIQIPDLDDIGVLAGQAYQGNSQLPNGSTVAVTNTGGVRGQWTTSLSSIPYAQDIYSNPSPIVSNGATDGTYFYRQGADYQFNYPPLYVGDTFRENEFPANVTSPSPNYTFINVYNPTGGADAASNTQAATPGEVLLAEFSYLSAASRNSIKHNVYNCVDVYVDGSNPTDASCVFLPGIQLFTANPGDVLYIEDFRRDGEPVQRPQVGNFFTPLFQSPLTSLPDTITVTVGATVYNYYLGYHYWLVHEISTLGGSVRARDGIEWNSNLNADDGTTGGAVPGAQPPIPYSQPTAPYTPGSDVAPGSTTVASLASAQTQVEIDDYYYDSNVVTLQATMERSRPITVDVLCHSAITRYFKPDVTVVYAANANIAVTNSAISAALSSYFNNRVFGGVCLLSDILTLIKGVPGVQNVRWSNDLPTVPTEIRVYETDVNGYPLHTPWIDRVIPGNSSTSEVQRLYMPAFGTFGSSDTFQIQTSPSSSTSQLNFNNLSASTLSSLLNATVTQDPYTGTPQHPMRSFTIAYKANGTQLLPTIFNVNVSQSFYAYDNDFFLHDNELAASPTGMAPNDTVAGALIRARAQGTFVRPGIG
jgi:uncharacterized phage protein gp47/JayE